MKPSFSFYRFHHIPQHIPVPRVNLNLHPTPPLHTHTQTHSTHTLVFLFVKRSNWMKRGEGCFAVLRYAEENLFISNSTEENLQKARRKCRGGVTRIVSVLKVEEKTYSNRFRDQTENVDELSPVECWNEGIQKRAMFRNEERMDYWWGTGVVNLVGAPVLIVGSNQSVARRHRD